MKILLMSPLMDPSFGRDLMDLGLGYLAACLQKEGHSVRLCLKAKEFPTLSAFSDFIRQDKFNIYGIKVISSSIKAVRETAKIIRETDPDATIVLGGPHVTCDPQNVFYLIPEADYAFYAESEIGFIEFVRRFSSGSLSAKELAEIPNLIWRKKEETTVNKLEIVQDLDTLPFPAWELMEPKQFSNFTYTGYSRRAPIAPIMTTRGCPYKCTYCGAGIMNGRKIRSRSAENVMEEIKLLTTRFGVKEIAFLDSNCAHRKGPLREVCKRIISENIDITWCAPVGVRLDSIDKEVAALMKQSGCFQVGVGIESGSPRILKKIKKSLPLKIVSEKINILRQAGIEVIGFFMIGFPGETAEEIKKTISFSLELPLTGASFHIVTPFPGTELYEEVGKDRAMDIEILNSLDQFTYKNSLSEIPHDQLRKIQKNAYLQFHFRPRIIKHILKNLNSFQKIKYIAQRVYEDSFKG